MAAERSIIASVLKLTRTGPAQKSMVQRDAKVAFHILDKTLLKLSKSGFIDQRRGLVEASPNQRVKMAVQAVKLGSDFEQICKFLVWTEFESIAAEAFEADGFTVLRNFRFKHAGKRWEIDVLGCKEPLVVCVDCKHWRRGRSRAATVKAVEAQVERTKALANSAANYYEKASMAEWERATLIPLVLSLVPGPFKFHNRVPIVPVLQVQDFISKLPFEVNLLTFFQKKLSKLNKKLTSYCK